MPRGAHIAIDLIAVTTLAFAVYFPRYRRRDLLVSYLAVNIGVLAVVTALTSADVGVGAGFGLFGILSIVRVRSDELAQPEVAYYFSALALGLLGGVDLDPDWPAPVLSALIVAALYLGDHPRLLARNRHQVITLDHAECNEGLLREHLDAILGAEIQHIHLRRLDLVNDSTTVDVRYRVPVAEPVGKPTET